MGSEVQEYRTALPNVLCDDIIELFMKEEIEMEKMVNYENRKYKIPKNEKKWMKIEKVLYRVLLMCMKKYDEAIYDINVLENTHKLRDILILESFCINEYYTNNDDVRVKDYNKTLSRYNVLTFIYFLNTIDESVIEIGIGERKYNIEGRKGSLYIFTENIDYSYKYKIPKDKRMYMITGQLRSKSN